MLQQWADTRSHMPSPPADGPPDFEEAQSDPLVSDSYDNIFPYTHSYTFSDDFRKSSPTSSNEAEVDVDPNDLDHDMWDPNFTNGFSINLDLDNDNEDNNWGSNSVHDSPSYSEPSASVGSPLEDDLYDDDRVGDVPDADEKDEPKTT
jgi:hypothetical protein